MTTLYEHRLLGSKILMVSATFNIPFLSGDGNICLYESGITLVDINGDEKYIIELEGFKVSYEKFINIRELKYLGNNIVFLKNVDSEYRKRNNMFKRVKGIFYGKLVISIPQIGDIALLDNKTLKYKNFYDKIHLLKKGINPLYDSNVKRKNNIMSFLKFKFNTKN